MGPEILIVHFFTGPWEEWFADASRSRLYLFNSLQHFIGDSTSAQHEDEWVKLECPE